jgi:hypothetical protein
MALIFFIHPARGHVRLELSKHLSRSSVLVAVAAQDKRVAVSTSAVVLEAVAEWELAY